MEGMGNFEMGKRDGAGHLRGMGDLRISRDYLGFSVKKKKKEKRGMNCCDSLVNVGEMITWAAEKSKQPKIGFKMGLNKSSHPTQGVIKLKPGEVDNITRSIMPGRNTLDCLMTLGGKFGFFNLFNLDDTSICHIPNEECLWKIQEDGLCMFSQGKCVMFGWGTTLSIRHTASEIKEIYCK
ncbi:hypothetical protein H5410_064091 [Solanum commersonii]|uniref:Uncharacterized protein n=1 Tax=Solanum commersonii TaxID=4109 RepID=A0A9J5W0K1_SOLCO|nr:hypothetical protein H5410_064091 [Solanum commersonii]